MTITLTLLLRIAGALHLALIGAGLLMPKVVRMRWHLVTLPPFIRQLFWVYYSFIALCLVSFSLITIVFADTLAAGVSVITPSTSCLRTCPLCTRWPRVNRAGSSSTVLIFSAVFLVACGAFAV